MSVISEAEARFQARRAMALVTRSGGMPRPEGEYVSLAHYVASFELPEAYVTTAAVYDGSPAEYVFSDTDSLYLDALIGLRELPREPFDFDLEELLLWVGRTDNRTKDVYLLSNSLTLGKVQGMGEPIDRDVAQSLLINAFMLRSFPRSQIQDSMLIHLEFFMKVAQPMPEARPIWIQMTELMGN